MPAIRLLSDLIRRVNVLIVLLAFVATTHANELRVGLFNVDASPEIGGPLAYDPCVEVTDPLTFRGLVLIGEGKPIVIGVVDWLGIANDAQTQLRGMLADRLETDTERIAIHAIHQHDAPRCDFSSAAILNHYGSTHPHYDVRWAREIFGKVTEAAAAAMEKTTVVDQIGIGQAAVEHVASNRRMLDDEGKVFVTRYTACRDPEVRALPVGTIDPMLRSITLHGSDGPIVVLTYYATHPQSYYRTGQANPDFPGYARNRREAQTGIPHIHFNGAGGNIGAGKWNDGSKENRMELAGRVADGMRKAFENSTRTKIFAEDVNWQTVSVKLPPGEHLAEEKLVATLDSDAGHKEKLTAAKHLSWLRRVQAGNSIDVQCLSLGNARLLHLPGELFVEYQLAAAKIRPDLFVAMAAYGEYGPGYIGTRIAYSQGGYETSERASRVGEDSEQILMSAIQSLLE